MRWLLCLFLLLPSLTFSAQESERLFVYATINAHSIQPTPTPGKSPFSLQFFNQLDQRLTAEGIDVIFLTDDEGEYPDFFENTADYPGWADADSPVLVVNVTTYGDYDALYLSPFAAYQFDPLPMGSPYWTAIATIQPDVKSSLQSSVSLAAGMGLHILQRCDLAQPYFDAALQDDSLIEDGVLIYRAVHFYRGNCAYLLGDQLAAVGDYRAGMDYEGQAAEQGKLPLYNDALSINLAYVYIELDEPDKALELLDDHRDVDYGTYSTREMERFLERADLYLALGEDEKAVDEITRLIELADDDVSTFAPDEMARLYAERGWRYAQSGNTDAAMSDYEQAIEIDATYPKVYYWRGLLHYQREDFDEAKADFETFLELVPDFYDYYEFELDEFVVEAEEYLSKLE